MKPARLFIREDQDEWLDQESLKRGGNHRSALNRLAIDLLIAQVVSGAVRLDTELAQREGAGS